MCIYMCVYTRVCGEYRIACGIGLVLFLFHVSPRVQILVFRHGGKCIYSVNHPSCWPPWLFLETESLIQTDLDFE